VPSLATARSFLFAPGSDGAKLRKALSSAADAVIADLEDAVLPAEKERAREVVAEALGDRPLTGSVPTGDGGLSPPGDCPLRPLRLVRVNGADTRWFEDDLALVGALELDGLVLPKATPEAAAAAERFGLPLIAIVETAQGLRRAYDTASQPAVVALVLGAVDLGLALGLQPRPDGLELLHARSTLVVDSAAAGIRAPIDQVWTDVRDAEGLAGDCRLARSLGLRGKACIHPAQLDVVNDAFAPSPDELHRARDVVDAFERAGAGAVALDGEMIDLPVVERARQLLAESKRGVLHAD
jgi:citrate lyase subunit beta/citryl-CoA lyase